MRRTTQMLKTHWVLPLMLALVGLLGCSQSETPAPALKDVYSSARAIEAALETGISYQDYSSLVLTFSRELKLLDDQVSFNTRKLPIEAVVVAKRYRELLEIYRDSGVVWSLEVRDKKQSSELRDLARKYGVSNAIYMDPQYPALVESVNFEEIRQSAWSKASREQELITPILFGKSPLAK